MRAPLYATLVAAAVIALAGCGQDSAAPAGDTSAPAGTTGEPPVSTTPEPAPPTGSKPPADPRPPDGTRPPGGSLPSPPVSVSPSGPVVPEGVTRVPADQVDASALPDYYDYRGQVWVFDDGYSLQTFAAASSGCSGAEAIVVDQSDSEIRIMLRPLPQPPGGRPDGGACTTVMTPRPVTVALTEPLGDRTILLASGR